MYVCMYVLARARARLGLGIELGLGLGLGRSSCCKVTHMLFFFAGREIAELSVPGINLDFLKRPHDLALRMLVQDLCLVDRIQTFGPEYELVVCSSGRALLGLSPPGHTPTTTPIPTSASVASISEDLFDETQAGNCGSLLALSYTLIQPCSPLHPAMLEAEEGEGLEGEEEAVIHRINVQCTAVDAIGTYIHCGRHR